jgi:hypothetical protein
MADALTKYAEFLKRGSMPLVADSDGVLRDMYLRQPKPLETNMDFAGAEITAVDPAEKPMVQDLAETVIQAEAPREREDKYKVLNRMLKFGDILGDQVQPDPERVRRLDADLNALRTRSAAAPRKLDLSDIESEMKAAQKGQNEWSGDDYLKAALVAILPSVAGGLMGGLGGAAGAAPAGVEGLKMAMAEKKDKGDKSMAALKNKAAMRVAEFNAESQDEARQIKSVLDRVDMEMKAYGSLTKPTQDFVKAFLSNMRGLEGQLYGQDIQAELGEAAEAGREGRAADVEAGKADRFGKQLEATDRQKAAERDARERIAAADRASREKIAKASEKAKAAGGKMTAGGLRLSPDKVLKVQEGFSIPSLIDDVRLTILNNKRLFDPIKGNIGSINPYDQEAQVVNSQISAAAQAFGKYMEGGVLRAEDERKYRKMFPNLGDLPRVAESKLLVVEKMLQEKIASEISALQKAGYDVTPFPATKNIERPGILDENQTAEGYAKKHGITPQQAKDLFQLRAIKRAQGGGR